MNQKILFLPLCSVVVWLKILHLNVKSDQKISISVADASYIGQNLGPISKVLLNKN